MRYAPTSKQANTIQNQPKQTETLQNNQHAAQNKLNQQTSKLRKEKRVYFWPRSFPNHKVLFPRSAARGSYTPLWIYIYIYICICFYIYRYIYIYIYIRSPPEDPPGPLKTHKINIFEGPLGVPGPLETYWLPLYKIITFANALQLAL